MEKKALFGIMLTLLLIGMSTLAFNIQTVKVESTDRKVGVNVGYWIQYGISVTWESDDPDATTPQYVLDSQQLVFFSNVVQSVSGTNITFDRIMYFQNGTEKSDTYWIDVDTGRGSSYLFFISANLSAGDIIYTGIGDVGEINETITRTYLGELVEINHHNSTVSGASYFIYADIYWNRATGVLYEFYMNHTTYTTKGEETYATRETQWLYPIGVVGVARTWTVDDDGPADFSSIQEAIDSPLVVDGDTIYVHNGTYYEHVTIDKSISLIGEDRSTSIIDGSRNETVISVIADHVNISRLTIQNGYHIPHVTYGIKVGEWEDGCKNVAVYDNIISDNDIGIFVYYSSNVVVLDNIIFNNYQGLDITLSNDNHIEANSLFNNEEGIVIGSNANSNMIRNNEISNNDFGIHVGWSMGNNIVGNTISLNAYAGIRFDSSNNNSIIGNTINSSNRDGIVLFGSNSNTIIMNELIQNKWDGIAVWYSNANVIYHNSFQANAKQAGSYSGSTNTWDDGYPSGGNYWSDYIAKGGYDADDDGIGDVPYVIDAYNQDSYPLIEPWTPLPRTVGELKTKIEELGFEGQIDNQGIVKSLIAKLNTAQKLVDEGKIDEAKTILADDFIPLVQNRSEIHITPEVADVLIKSAEYILSHL